MPGPPPRWSPSPSPSCHRSQLPYLPLALWWTRSDILLYSVRYSFRNNVKPWNWERLLTSCMLKDVNAASFESYRKVLKLSFSGDLSFHHPFITVMNLRRSARKLLASGRISRKPKYCCDGPSSFDWRWGRGHTSMRSRDKYWRHSAEKIRSPYFDLSVKTWIFEQFRSIPYLK